MVQHGFLHGQHQFMQFRILCETVEIKGAPLLTQMLEQVRRTGKRFWSKYMTPQCSHRPFLIMQRYRNEWRGGAWLA